jgi:hypothetical protein
VLGGKCVGVRLCVVLRADGVILRKRCVFVTQEMDRNTILPQMSSACNVSRSMNHLSSKTTLKMIYFAYFHSVMEYGIAFWGGAAESKSYKSR